MKLFKISRHVCNAEQCIHYNVYVNVRTCPLSLADPSESTSHTTAGNLVPAPPSTEKPNDPSCPSGSVFRSNSTTLMDIFHCLMEVSINHI